MFWGIVLENGKRYHQVVDDGFHISMAALEPQWEKKNKANNDAPISVMMEREKTEFLLCTLSHGKRPQQPLDLNFAEGEAVTLFLNGEGIVHLTGYVIEAEPEDLECSYGDEEDSEIDDEEASEDDLDTFYREEEKAIKRKASPKKQIAIAAKKQKVESSDEDDVEFGEDDDDSDDDDDEEDDIDASDDEDSDDQLVIKNQQSQSPKKPAIKAAPSGGLMNNKKSISPPKKVTIVATPKSEAKKQTLPKTPAASEKGGQQNKNAQGPQTPALNGEKSPNESLSASAKRRRARKQRRESAAQNAASPEKTPAKDQNNADKTPGKGQNNINKTPAKGQNNADKTPGKGQNNADKTPGKGQNNAVKTPGKGQRRLAGGVVVEDLQVGHGPEAKAGKMVHVHYIGKLSNNKEFDSCLKGQQPFKFRLGGNEVIKGWDTGLQGMKVGGRRKLVIPPNQGYGNKGMSGIPPNSTLNFEVQLVSVS